MDSDTNRENIAYRKKQSDFVLKFQARLSNWANQTTEILLFYEPFFIRHALQLGAAEQSSILMPGDQGWGWFRVACTTIVVVRLPYRLVQKKEVSMIQTSNLSL